MLYLGSSISFHAELEQIKHQLELLSKEATMPQDDLERAEYVLGKLLKQSQLSIEMQLPMFMSW